MGRANVVTIITLSSVFGTTVLVLLILLLRNYCQRRRHLQPVTRPWRGGSLRNQSQSTDKLVRMYTEPPLPPKRAAAMAQNRPYPMSPGGAPATFRPTPAMGAEKRSAILTRSPTSPPLSSKEWLAEDVGMENAGSTVGSGRGGLGRLDHAPTPPPPFPHSPTPPPPPGPPELIAAPQPPRPRPRPRPVEQVPRAPRAVARLQPSGSSLNNSLPSLESVTSERLEQFYAPWVREMMEQGRREIRVKAVVGQRDPDGRVGLPPPGSTVPRAAGRGG